MCIDLEALCIWIIVVIGLIAIAQLLLPWLMSLAALPPIVIGILRIVLWMIVAIAVVKIIFMFLSCVFPGIAHGRFF